MYYIGNERLTIMRLVWMIEPEDDMVFFSEAFFEPSDKMMDILSGSQGIDSISFIDEDSDFFFAFIELDHTYMICHELPGISFMDFPEE